MTYSDPSSRHPTRAQVREGCWECPECEAFNNPWNDECWNCGERPPAEIEEKRDE